MKTQDKPYSTMAGGAALSLNITGYLLCIASVIILKTPITFVFATLGLLLMIFMSCGFFTLQPNQTGVLNLFGAYKGTVREEGFHWVNPFMSKRKISMRIRNFNSEVVKVNDADGNPIEIGAVVVWKVVNAAQAVFDVDHFEEYVETQSESAVRHLASLFPYDTPHEKGRISLRGSTDEVSELLNKELQERLATAGVRVEEARLSHLAYAPEIASAMLQRQQAQAVVDARNTIVEGAVGMVQMALERLKDQGVIELDEERRAAMVSNLLVVLCGDKAAHPVVNAGSIYH